MCLITKRYACPYCCRDSTRMTCVADHVSPFAVGILRLFNPAAMARSDVAPLACNSAITGARSAARCAATRSTASLPRCRIARVSRCPWRLPPSLTPRRFAAASASLVRWLIIRPSRSATIARTPTVNRSACGMSAQTKSTPAQDSVWPHPLGSAEQSHLSNQSRLD
jgi:hypothetical protein